MRLRDWFRWPALGPHRREFAYGIGYWAMGAAIFAPWLLLHPAAVVAALLACLIGCALATACRIHGPCDRAWQAAHVEEPSDIAPPTVLRGGN